MKSITTNLKNHLAEEVTTLANCWSITRRDGQQFHFTDHDEDLVVLGNTHLAEFGYQQTAVTSSAALAVDNLEVTGIFDVASITSDDLRAGLYDFAEVALFAVNWADLTQGIMRLRRGYLGEVTVSPSGIFNAELRGLIQRLVAKVGQVYTPECRADLGDRKCRVDLAPFTFTETVNLLGDAAHFGATNGNSLAVADGYYNAGVVTWLTGLNSGRSMEVKNWGASGAITYLFQAMPRPITLGDTFRIYTGCDKRHDTCRDKFNNIVNRQAEDFIPGMDAIMQSPSAPDASGGGGGKK